MEKMSKEELRKLALELSTANARFAEQNHIDRRELYDTLEKLPVARNGTTRDLSLHELINNWNGTSSSTPVEEFLKRVPHAAQCGNWTDADCVIVCKLKLAGAASAFVESNLVLRRNDIAFESLSSALIERYGDTKSWDHYDRLLQDATQGPREDVKCFADRCSESKDDSPRFEPNKSPMVARRNR